MKPNLDNNVKLHPSYKNWEIFLQTCDLRLTSPSGYKIYNSSNNWYIVDLGGNVTCSFGFHICRHAEDVLGIRQHILRRLLKI